MSPARGAPVPVEEPSRRVRAPRPADPPLQPVDVATLPERTERVDLFLLMGQSNMKGRGVVPDEPNRDPRIVMMHLKDDQWYVARHPLHLVGDPRTFAGADNAGVGPGLSFAETLATRDPSVRVGLIPCAVGGSSVADWRKGGTLYAETLRRAKLALHASAPANGRLRGVLWHQGEADADTRRLPAYQASLLALVDDLRADLAIPDLPFIACTIGEMRPDIGTRRAAELNRLLLALPRKRARTACVDARDLTGHIGDRLHFDAETQRAIGQRYAETFIELTGGGRRRSPRVPGR